MEIAEKSENSLTVRLEQSEKEFQPHLVTDEPKSIGNFCPKNKFKIFYGATSRTQ